jgi:hypothetical protein
MQCHFPRASVWLYLIQFTPVVWPLPYRTTYTSARVWGASKISEAQPHNPNFKGLTPSLPHSETVPVAAPSSSAGCGCLS